MARGGVHPATRRVVVELESEIADVVRDLTIEVRAELQLVNPVLTGWSRANWVGSVGGPAPGPHGARGDGNGSADAAGAEGVSALLGYKIEMGSAYVTNHVPYVPQLNDRGNPEPQWIEAAIDRAVAIVKARRRLRP